MYFPSLASTPRTLPASMRVRWIAFIPRKTIPLTPPRSCFISTRWSASTAAPACPCVRCRPFSRSTTCQKTGANSLRKTRHTSGGKPAISCQEQLSGNEAWVERGNKYKGVRLLMDARLFVLRKQNLTSNRHRCPDTSITSVIASVASLRDRLAILQNSGGAVPPSCPLGAAPPAGG